MLNNRTNISQSIFWKYFTLVFVTVVLLAPSLMIGSSDWRGSATLHTMMELIAMFLALIIGISGLVRYYAKPNERLLLYIGAGFIGTGLLDGYHAIVTSEFFVLYFPSPNETLIPWSWIASRLYLSVFLAWAVIRLRKPGAQVALQSRRVLYTMAITTISCFVFFAFVPLPRAYYPELFLHRPEELLPALMFLFALIGFYVRGRWRYQDFEFYLMLFLLISVVGQLVYMPFSSGLFDYEFDIAHLLKKLSYITVLIGVYVSMLQSFRTEHIAVSEVKDLTLTQKGLEIQLGKQAARVKLFSDALEQSNEAVAITDKNGTIQYINKAFTEVTGYEAIEALGKTSRILKSGVHDESFYKDLWSTILSGAHWQQRMMNRRKDESLYPTLMSISPIKNDANEITHFVGIQQDLTSYENMEEQFRQSQKMEAVGTLVGGIAHDFNNTLAGIIGNVFLLKQKVKDSETLERIDMINNLSVRGAEMIRKLLAFARKDSGVKTSINVYDFLKETIKLSRISIPESTQLIDNVENHQAFIKGDINLLQQVFMNLINNARDAVLEKTGEKTISITHSIVEINKKLSEKHPELVADSYVCIEITDNGCGIPESDLKHIFEPFFTTKDVDKGTGLGLAMSYGAIQSHQGAIEVKSEVNVGTNISIYIPLLISSEIIHQSPSEESLINGDGETILLVDDEISLTETGKAVLESIGYKVMIAHNGKEAIDIFLKHKEHIELIISDVVMPIMSGVEAIKEIREVEPDIKIIFATGYDSNSQIASIDNLDEEFVINKPYSAFALSSKVAEVLNKT